MILILSGDKFLNLFYFFQKLDLNVFVDLEKFSALIP